ncbi:right-handed parallel beta-helix repeat-containing protein [Planctomonas psychrotolerans]|uniref:right-handed parallel beta-helix repeat-containing protein n=1 Tax=Planctomonas psychrotolerans TaxID=2528712 RepID=UPI00123AA8E0|nr:right-handed parallel beta-helix repeat-containing protein [Planctomonas psychrotolerans]
MRALVTGIASALLVPALVAVPVGSATAAEKPDASAPRASDASITGERYTGDPSAEALMVAAEDRRIIDVRAVANAAKWTGASQYKPYRLVTGNTYTLVLTERDAEYSFDNLLALSPRSLVRQPDGSYLLTENIVVEEGATLNLRDDDGLELRLASNEDYFVSIVTMGGSLVLAGTAEEPVEVTSWDIHSGEPDRDTSDGRSYVRVVGGHAAFSYAEFHDLGFWSGMTGGVSLTGTELPAELPKDQEEAAEAAAGDALKPTVYGTELIPAEPVEGEPSTLALEPDLTGYSYVSATIANARFSDNAFGLFVTSADNVDVRDAVVENSLVDGMTFHRNVTNSRVSRVTARNNAVDGISLARATSGVTLERVTATDNGRNGISIDGRPLTEGPSPTGLPIGVYGNNEVTNSTATDNGRYGIEIAGGTNLIVDNNAVRNNEIGIVVSDGVDSVTITDNLVEDSDLQGVALREDVTDATVQGNTVVGGDIGIYLRDAYGVIARNEVEDVTNHAITLIGTAATSTVQGNTASGSGPSAIDVKRAADTAVVRTNDLTGWRSTKPLDVVLRSIFQPLTVMWLSLGLLVVVSAITSVRRKRSGIVHPYANLAPLASFSKGVVLPEEAGAGRHRLTQMFPDSRPHGSDETGRTV